jgi:predicted DNA-binding protein
MASVTTSIRLDAQLARRLEKTASRLSRGKNWVIARAIEEYLARVNRDDLAAEARRQSLLLARAERRKGDDFWEENFPEWK